MPWVGGNTNNINENNNQQVAQQITTNSQVKSCQIYIDFIIKNIKWYTLDSL